MKRSLLWPAVCARMKEGRREQIVTLYLAQGLQILCENTARLSGGRYLRYSLRQLLRDGGYDEGEERIERSAEAIIGSIRAKIAQSGDQK